MTLSFVKGAKIGILEFVFVNEDTACVVSTSTIEGEWWIFYPICMGKRTVQVRIGAVLPEINPKWLVAAIRAKIEEEYNILSVQRTEILNWWQFSLGLKIQMTHSNMKALPDEIALADGRRLNAIIRERLPLSHNCKTRGHTRKDCPTLEHTKNEKAAGAESSGTAAVTGAEPGSTLVVESVMDGSKLETHTVFERLPVVVDCVFEVARGDEKNENGKSERGRRKRAKSIENGLLSKEKRLQKT